MTLKAKSHGASWNLNSKTRRFGAFESNPIIWKYLTIRNIRSGAVGGTAASSLPNEVSGPALQVPPQGRNLTAKSNVSLTSNLQEGEQPPALPPKATWWKMYPQRSLGSPREQRALQLVVFRGLARIRWHSPRCLQLTPSNTATTAARRPSLT